MPSDLVRDRKPHPSGDSTAADALQFGTAETPSWELGSEVVRIVSLRPSTRPAESNRGCNGTDVG